MRVLVACALVACHAATSAPPPPPVAITKPRSAPDPVPADTRSFLQRTSPYLGVVPHAEVVVTRREGPERIDEQLSVLSGYMRECYMSAPFPFNEPRQDHMTMTIDARDADTSVEIEPPTMAALASCLVRSLVSSHFDSGANRVTLIIDGAMWFTSSGRAPL
jgi:hypothetical protein